MAHLSILLAWSLLAPLLIGLGGVGWWLLRPDPAARWRPFWLFWLGWSLTLFILQVWHVLAPVDAWPFLLLVPLSVFGWTRLARLPRERWEAPRWSLLLFLGLAGVLCVVCAGLSLRRPGNPDTCLYYMQTVRWFAAYPLVQGMANFDELLAFNNGYHLYVALLDVGPFTHRSHHLANGILVLSVTLAGLAVLLRRLATRRAPGGADFLQLLLLALGLELLPMDTASPAADLALWGAKGALVLWCLLPALERREVRPFDLRVALYLACGAVVAKLSAAVVALPFILFVAAGLFRTGPRQLVRSLPGLAAIGLGTLAPWLFRNAWLSGYPLYPSSLLALPVPWRLAEARVEYLALYIKAYARYRTSAYGATMNLDGWVQHWLEKEWLDNRQLLVPVGVLVLALALIAVRRLRGRGVSAGAAALAPCLASVLLWAVTAPDVRFLAPVLWLTAGVAVFVAWPRDVAGALERPHGLTAFALLVLLGGLGTFDLRGWVRFPADFEPPEPERFTTARLESGETVRISTGCCLYPPCAYRAFVEPLRLNRPGDFASGFRVVHPAR